MTKGTSDRRREIVLGPVTLTEGVLTMRSPRLRDAEAWSSARLSNRAWLERAFPAWGDDWEAEQSPTAWVERVRHLRRVKLQGGCPLVVLLDGVVIGEVGIDAVDAESGTGEASSWLIRDHGGANVSVTASALLLHHVFGRADPLDRVLGPVATSSRRGRAPGLEAVGFTIEATAPRRLSNGTTVDHDMWILHNTPEVRALLAAQATGAGPATARTANTTARSALPVLVPAVARVLVREARRILNDRGRTSAASPRRVPFAGGVVDVDTDAGTATTTFVPRLHDPQQAESLATALAALVDAEVGSARVQRLDIRLSPSVFGLTTRLAGLGFVHAASYSANPAGPNAYPGEQVWTRTTR